MTEKTTRRRPDRASTAPDEGFSLIELLVAMTMLLVVGTFFFVWYLSLTSSATNTSALSETQGSVRNVMRAVEADLRSADPLVLVPQSFTLDPNGCSSSCPNGATATDIVALFTTNDRYSPCRTSATTVPPPSPFQPATITANLVWAYDPKAHTLTRYSLCNGNWSAGMSLRNITSPAATMFTVAQDQGSGRSQQPLPTPPTVVNQSTPVCGTSITVTLVVQTSNQQTPFRVQVVEPLPNEASILPLACGP